MRTCMALREYTSNVHVNIHNLYVHVDYGVCADTCAYGCVKNLVSKLILNTAFVLCPLFVSNFRLVKNEGEFRQKDSVDPC